MFRDARGLVARCLPNVCPPTRAYRFGDLSMDDDRPGRLVQVDQHHRLALTADRVGPVIADQVGAPGVDRPHHREPSSRPCAAGGWGKVPSGRVGAVETVPDGVVAAIM